MTIIKIDKYEHILIIYNIAKKQGYNFKFDITSDFIKKLNTIKYIILYEEYNNKYIGFNNIKENYENTYNVISSDFILKYKLKNIKQN